MEWIDKHKILSLIFAVWILTYVIVGVCLLICPDEIIGKDEDYE